MNFGRSFQRTNRAILGSYSGMSKDSRSSTLAPSKPSSMEPRSVVKVLLLLLLLLKVAMTGPDATAAVQLMYGACSRFSFFS